MDDTVELQALPIVQVIDDAVMPPKRAEVTDDLEAVYPLSLIHISEPTRPY